jgi:hypothetical protein
MNFLQLCQRAREKCEFGSESTPTTVVGQVGRLGQLVNWVNEAWLYLQNRRDDWKWMRGSVSFTTTAGDADYTLGTGSGTVGVSNARIWLPEKFRIYKTATGRSDEGHLVYWDWDWWHDTYDFGSNATLQQRPVVWTERPEDHAILLAPIPDDDYTVTGRYVKAASELSGDSDTPGMPSEYHMAIVYKVMMIYGAADGAAEVRLEGEQELKKIMAQLEAREVTQLSLGYPLA